MLSKRVFVGIFAISVLLLTSVVSFGQVSKIAGKVYKKDAAGKLQTVEGVKIACYRTDTEMPCRSAVTDQNGTFVILGVPIGGKFILGVSGTDLEPTFVPEMVAGSTSENIEVAVVDGDGREATEEQVRASANLSATGELTDDQKKAQAELEKKRLEILEKNKKIEESNATRERAAKEGKEAFEKADFDTAIAKFDEGFKADPTFIGAAPLMLNNKAVSYKQRGVTNYNAAAKSAAAAAKSGDSTQIRETSTKLVEMKKALISDLDNGLTAALAARSLYKNATAAERSELSDPKDFESRNENIIDECFKILAQLNVNLLNYEDTDEQRIAAIKLYKDGYAAQPSNENIMAGLSFALYMESQITGEQSLLQESLNYGTKVLKTIDEKHPLHEAVKGIVDQLKADGLKPQAIN